MISKSCFLILSQIFLFATIAISPAPIQGVGKRAVRQSPENPSIVTEIIPEDNEFVRVVLPGGLSSKIIQTIAQDQLGFIWIGTEGGLYKYDGYEFTLYQHDSRDTSSYINDIESILIDSQYAIWVGTPDGLFRFDRETNTFTNYHDEHIFDIYEDSEGTLWVSALDDIYQFDSNKDELTRWAFSSYGPIITIHESRGGYMWFGTTNGLIRYDPRIPPSENIKLYRHSSQDPNSISGDVIMSIVEDQAGNLWVGTVNHGVNRLSLVDEQNTKFDRYTQNPDDADSLSSDGITSMVVDHLGNLWVGTMSGLNQYDQKLNRFIQFDSGEFSQIFSGIVLDLFVDRAGLLWVGSIGALDRLDATAKRFRPFPDSIINEHTILSGFLDQNGDQWFGTYEAGLFKLDHNPPLLHHFQHDPDNPNSLSNNSVRAIYRDSQGILWIGTENGLNIYDASTESFTQDARFSGYGIRTIFEDPTNRLWIGTTGGIFNSLRTIRRFSKLRDEYVFDIETEEGGNVWLGTITGLYLVDGTGRFLAHYTHSADDPQSLSHDMVTEVYKDPNGVLWIGTGGGGIDRFDETTQTFKHYTEEDGLASNMVYCMLGDVSGNLWIGTDRSVTKFNSAAESFHNYDSKDGLSGDEVVGCIQSDHGEMVFAGLQGLSLLSPDDIQDNLHLPPVVITAFKKYNQTVKTDLSNDDVIQLAYDDNFISFEFAALDYVHPEKNQYAYMMEGLDDDWVYAKTRRLADYPDLKPGTYTFRVIASNNDGFWNEIGTAVRITVTPPGWQTWWFWSLMGLALIGIVYSGYRIRVHNIKARSHELEEQVESRTREIDQRRQEIEALYRADEELHRHLQLDQVLRALVHTALDILQADKGALMVWDEAREQLTVRVSRGYSPETLPLMSFAPGQGIAGKVGTTGEPALVENVLADPQVTKQIVEAERIRSLIQVPITIKDEIFGVFSADFTQPRQFTKEEERLLISLAQRAALAIENARLFTQAQELGILKERNRLARDLHDSVTQSMYSVTMYADAASRQLSSGQPEIASDNLSKLRIVVKDALRDLRLLIFELRPHYLQKDGLVAAIEARLDAVENRSGIQIDFAVDGRSNLSFHMENGLYRIALEALTNALKHAQADHIQIRLQFGQESTSLTIQDDGVGFDPAISQGYDGMGIPGMIERAKEIGAEFHIESNPGDGTQVTTKVKSNNAPVKT